MREPQIVDSPVFSPGTCFTCGGIEGQMVDTMVDVVGDGRVYVCLRTCLPLMAGLAGYLTSEQAGEVAARLAAAAETEAELRAELERERDTKTVSLSDLRKLMPQPKVTAGKTTKAAA